MKKIKEPVRRKVAGRLLQKLLFKTPLHCAWLFVRRRLNQLYSLLNRISHVLSVSFFSVDKRGPLQWVLFFSLWLWEQLCVMINSVLLPNESNQPLVDNLFTKKTFSDLLSLAEFILVYWLLIFAGISQRNGSMCSRCSGKHPFLSNSWGRKKVHPFVEVLFIVGFLLVAPAYL